MKERNASNQMREVAVKKTKQKIDCNTSVQVYSKYQLKKMGNTRETQMSFSWT
jgi:hypothetical protein